MFNSVGYGNYRYFLLTVLQLWFASVFGFVETLGPFMAQRERWLAINATLGTAHSNAGSAAAAATAAAAAEAAVAGESLQLEALWQLLMLCVICIVVIGHFAGWHVWHCVLNGQTTIEAYRRAALAAQGGAAVPLPKGNPYDWGSRDANWRRHFGDRTFIAAL